MEYTGPKETKYLPKEEMQWVWLKNEKIFWLLALIIYFGYELITFIKFTWSKQFRIIYYI